MTFVLEVFMNIIIVGCGKVGYTLVEQLGGENHNITVIDTNEEKVNSITDDLDAMGIVGNGVSFQTLSEAGIDHADLLIAVTGSSSILPLEKVSILTAEGNWKIRAISAALDSSGLMIMASPSSSRRKAISLL